MSGGAHPCNIDCGKRQQLEKRIAELKAENKEMRRQFEEQQQLLELWMLYYTDGMPDDELRDLYCDSIEALEDD